MQDSESCEKWHHKRQITNTGETKDSTGSNKSGGRETMKGIPKSIEERDPTLLGKQYSFTGEEITYYHASDSLSR
jgi:hypothetical protein